MKRIVLAFAALMLVTASAGAVTLRGTVENGTTGAKNVEAKVVVINPSAGMEEMAEVQSKGGRFEFADLPAAGMYMVRVTHAGVDYLTPVQDPSADVAITVYDATTSWEGVRIVVPHLAASRRGDFLFIEQMFEITNDTSPARTIWERGGAFKLFLPTDMDSLVTSQVSAMGVNIDRRPEKTDAPGIYRVDYPIRPGVTRVAVSYVVPYTDGTYTMAAKFPQGVSHMTVYAVDPSMTVTSASHTFDSTEDVHGMTAYTLHGGAGVTDMTLTFTGGSPDFAGIQVEGEGGGHQEENILVAMGDEHKMSIFLLITVLLVLAGVVGTALRDRQDPLSDPKVLRGHYNLLVGRLARLDDLHAAEAIPADAYRVAREELMGRLSALAMRLRTHGGLHHPSEEPTHKTKAR